MGGSWRAWGKKAARCLKCSGTVGIAGHCVQAAGGHDPPSRSVMRLSDLRGDAMPGGDHAVSSGLPTC